MEIRNLQELPEKEETMSYEDYLWIKERILSEHRKYSWCKRENPFDKSFWAESAAKKIMDTIIDEHVKEEFQHKVEKVGGSEQTSTFDNPAWRCYGKCMQYFGEWCPECYLKHKRGSVRK
jgi:hypothetical protein